MTSECTEGGGDVAQKQTIALDTDKLCECDNDKGRGCLKILNVADVSYERSLMERQCDTIQRHTDPKSMLPML